MSPVVPPPQNGTIGAPPAPQRPTGPQRGAVEVAHRDLIQQWSQVQGWVNANRSALLFRQGIAKAADEWFAAGADPLNEDLLLHSGARLVLAEELPERLAQAYNDRERQYLSACTDRRKRERAKEELQRRRELDIRTRWLKFVGIFAVLATILALVSSILYVEQERQLRVNLAQELAAQALAEHARGQDEQAALLARQAYGFDAGRSVQGEVGTALQATVGAPYFSTLIDSHASWISGLAFSPNGDLLASASNDLMVGLTNVTDSPSEMRHLAGHAAYLTSVAFHPQAQRELLASGSADGTVRLWNPTSGEPVGDPLLGPGGIVDAVAFDGDQLLAAGSCLTNSGLPPTGDERAKDCATDTTDPKSTTGQGIVRLWVISGPVPRTGGWTVPEEGYPYLDLNVDASRVCAVAFSPVGGWLAAAGCDGPRNGPTGCGSRSGPLLLWQINQLEPISPPHCLIDHRGGIKALAFSPDGRTLASGGMDGSVRLWNISAIDASTTDVAPSSILGGHDEEIRSLAFGRDPNLLFSGSNDGSVALWNLDRSRPVISVLGTSAEWIRAVAVSGANGGMLASADAGGDVRLWSLGDPESAPNLLRGHQRYVRSMDFAPTTDANGRQLLASSAEDGTVRIWPVGQPDAEPTILDVRAQASSGKVSSVSFNCNGTLLATGSEDGRVIVWDIADPALTPMEITDHQRSGGVVVAFSPTDDLLVSGSAAATVQLWNPRTGEPIGARLLGPSGSITSVAFNQDGGTLAVAFSPTGFDPEATIRLWDVRGRAPAVSGCPVPLQAPDLARADIDAVSALPAPPVVGSYRVSSEVTSLAFNDDGKLLAAGYLDGTTHVWNVADGRDTVTLPGHKEEVRSVAFSPDGALLATGSMDQSVLIWDTSRWESDPVRILGLAEWVRAIAFSPDGEKLAVSSSDDDIRLILARTEAVADLACRRVTRNLTEREWFEFVGEDELTPFDWLFQEDPSEYRSTCEQFPPGQDDPIDVPEAAHSGPAMAWWTAPLQRASVTRELPPSRRHSRRGGSRALPCPPASGIPASHERDYGLAAVGGHRPLPYDDTGAGVRLRSEPG